MRRRQKPEKMKFRTGEAIRCCDCGKKSPFKFVSTSDSEIAKFSGKVEENFLRDLIYSFSESVIEVVYSIRTEEGINSLPILAVSCSSCSNFLHKQNVENSISCKSSSGGYRGSGASVFIVNAKNGLYGPLCSRCLAALVREIKSKAGGAVASVNGFKMGLAPDLLKSLYSAKAVEGESEGDSFEAII